MRANTIKARNISEKIFKIGTMKKYKKWEAVRGNSINKFGDEIDKENEISLTHRSLNRIHP